MVVVQQQQKETSHNSAKSPATRARKLGDKFRRYHARTSSAGAAINLSLLKTVVMPIFSSWYYVWIMSFVFSAKQFASKFILVCLAKLAKRKKSGEIVTAELECTSYLVSNEPRQKRGIQSFAAKGKLSLSHFCEECCCRCCTGT